jgi:hypothetical protein
MQNAIRMLIVFLAVFAFAAMARAQGIGSISGTVTDASGAVVPAAAVTATSDGTGAAATVKTNGSGSYVFPSLLPGTYTVTVSAPGFKVFEEKSVVLQADQAATVNAALQVGQQSQTISVNADAVQVDTVTGTLSQVIDSARVNDLPLNGRNAAQLTTLVAGVVSTPNDGTDAGVTKSFPVVVEISANGSLSGQTVYLLDGADNLDDYTDGNLPFPFPDALQEFSVQTSNYDAEYGQSPGGIVNVVTRSGTDRSHGDLFEFVRNGVFNARNYFAPVVDPLKRNQFGGTVGGPVIIPHLLSGKKTFFFLGYQKTIIRDQVNGQTAYVPTQAELAGNFSATCTTGFSSSGICTTPGQQIYDPFSATHAPFLNNMIPINRYDPAALAVTKDLPSVTGAGQVVYAVPTNQDLWEMLGRVDQVFGPHDRGFLHYYTDTFTQQGVLNTANLITYADQSNIHFQSAVIDETHSFTDNLLNDFNLGYEREITVRSPLAGSPEAATFGVNIYQPPQPSIQDITATGYFAIGQNPQATFQRNNYTLADNVHWVKGKHNLAFGASLELAKMDVNSLNAETGEFFFNSTNTNNGLASFLLGYMSNFQQGSGQTSNDRDQFYGFYGQDAWQITRRLNLSYGLRYEPFLPWQEIGHRLEQFSPTAFAAGQTSTVFTNAPKGLLFPGDPGVPEQGVRSEYKDFMPRVGFALDVFGDGKTSLRGGGGLFFQTRQTANLNQKSSQVTPFSTNINQTPGSGTFSNPYANSVNPFPTPSPAPSNYVFPSPVQVYTYDPSGNFSIPVTYEWNLTVEQQLTKSLLSRIAYVGAHSSHLFAAEELDPATYGPGATSANTTARRHFLGYSNIISTSMVGTDNYNSLQSTLQQRIPHGLNVMANYTWSHSVNDLPLESEITDQATGQSYVYPVYQPGYKSLDHGPPDFDRKHVFTGSYVWELPKLDHTNALVREVIDGWQTTGIFQIESGQPLTIVAGKDISLTNIGQDRAQYNGTSAYGPGACAAGTECKNYLIPSAFALPATGNFGNVIKGSFRGPGYFDWDAGLFRSFPVKEDARFEFRAEYFNLINHTNFTNPVTSLSSANFGGITKSNDPRIAQLSLKFLF